MKMKEPNDMMDQSRLLDLSNDIQKQVSQIQQHLRATCQLDPSFDGQAEPTNFEGVDDIRSSALDNLTELRDLLSTPRELLRERAPTDYVSRHAIDRFNIDTSVPINGSIPYEELAWATMLPVKTLRRILRHAITQRLFFETEAGHVAHTQASRLLAENSKVRDYFGTVSQEVWPAATKVCDALEKWPGSKERSESAYQLEKGQTIYDTLAQDPVKQARYDNAMGAWANDRSFAVYHIVDNYDWGGLGEATVVDVGGGLGTVSKALAKAFPLLDFIVEDRHDVLIKAEVEDPGLKDRVEFLEHNFLDPQPIKDAAVYFFRRVLMEWTDEKTVEILSALKPALKDGAAVLIQDPCVPDPGACSLWQERVFRNSDLLGLAIGNTSQRDSEEWKAIFDQAGPGFEFKGIKMIPDTDMALIEAVWRGERRASIHESLN